MENCSDQKRPGRISSNFDFSTNKYIVHGWGPFNFARCTIVLLLQANDKSAWRVTSGGRFASAKRICWFWSPSSQENSIFRKFHDFSGAPTAWSRPWSRYNFLLSLWIELRFCIHQAIHMMIVEKLFPLIFFWFFHLKFQRSHKNSTHCSRLTTFQFCPVHHSITLTSER